MGSISDFINRKRPQLALWESSLECFSNHHASATAPQYSITLPVHGRESAEMIDALNLYAHTDLIRRHIHLALVVNNGTMDERKQVSAIISQKLKDLYGEVSHSVYLAKDDELFQTISEIRLCLSLISLLQLQSLPEDKLSDHFLITHDIDMLDIAKNYGDMCRESFDDQSLRAAGGGIHHFSESPNVQLLLNIDQKLGELSITGGTAKPKFCGANSIIRSDAYVTSGGHNSVFRRKENIPIRNALMRIAPSSVRWLPDSWIKTSARRQETLFESGKIDGDLRKNFYSLGDASESYLGASSLTAQIAEMSDELKQQHMEKFLSDLLMKYIYLALMSHKPIRKHRDDRERVVKEIESNSQCKLISHGIVDKFIRICKDFGLEVAVDRYEVRVPNLKSLK